jgi:hypothetical protein
MRLKNGTTSITSSDANQKGGDGGRVPFVFEIVSWVLRGPGSRLGQGPPTLGSRARRASCSVRAGALIPGEACVPPARERPRASRQQRKRLRSLPRGRGRPSELDAWPGFFRTTRPGRRTQASARAPLAGSRSAGKELRRANTTGPRSRDLHQGRVIPTAGKSAGRASVSR